MPRGAPSFEINISFRKPQREIFRDNHRNKVVVAGGRFGKTELGLCTLVAEALRFPGSRGWYVAPTLDMAYDTAWMRLKVMLGLISNDTEEVFAEPSPAVRKVSEERLRITLANGSVIQLMTAQEPDRLRGRAIKTVVLDEFAQMDESIWPAIRPRIGDKELMFRYGELGRVLVIGTPSGANHFKDLFDDVRIGNRPEWKAWRFTSVEGGNIAASEIESAKADMSERDWRQEFEATFESIQGRVYHAFLRDYYQQDGNCDRGNLANVQDTGGTLMVGADFNVNPMTWVVGNKVAVERKQRVTQDNPAGISYELHIWKEYRIENCNTAMMCEQLKRDFGNRKMMIFPDPTGGARHTVAANVGETDHTIIKHSGLHSDIYLPKFKTKSDKYNCVNGVLCNSLGHRRLLVNPRTCPHLVKSLDGLTYVGGSNLPDKSTGFDHATDALAYMTVALFPLTKGGVAMVRVAL